MARLARFVAGRRTKWIVPVVWIVLVAIFAPLGSKLADATDDRTEAQLPANAESTEVLKLQADRFKSGQTTTGLIIYQRDGGLTDRDLAFTVLSIPNDNDRIADWGKDVRDAIDSGETGGLNTYVSGNLGVFA